MIPGLSGPRVHGPGDWAAPLVTQGPRRDHDASRGRALASVERARQDAGVTFERSRSAEVGFAGYRPRGGARRALGRAADRLPDANDTGRTSEPPAAQRSSAAGAASDSASGEPLSPQDQDTVAELRERDREVRAHENAHAAAGGGYASAPSYTYVTGPDGKRYAVGGEVQIDAAPVEGNPEATIEKMRVVIRAAMAPAEPSGQDQRVAASATQTMLDAQRELVARKTEEANADSRSRHEANERAAQAVDVSRPVDAGPVGTMDSPPAIGPDANPALSPLPGALGSRRSAHTRSPTATAARERVGQVEEPTVPRRIWRPAVTRYRLLAPATETREPLLGPRAYA
ncbi:MAG: hypothetical protein B7733_26100 [Myxococcales bacterium FL481]|nr:MAG: hypothetical protein B7733_26100 [Myxococcales bacterium FL481]